MVRHNLLLTSLGRVAAHRGTTNACATARTATTHVAAACDYPPSPPAEITTHGRITLKAAAHIDHCNQADHNNGSCQQDRALPAGRSSWVAAQFPRPRRLIIVLPIMIL